MFEFKPDYEQVYERYMAWWNGEVIDRALTSIYLLKPISEHVPYPESRHKSLRDRWMDAEFNAQRAYAWAANTLFYADALPIQYPNLGPEIFSAFYGCELEFGETTSWSEPCLESWDPGETAKLRLDLDSEYARKLMELTDAYLEVARGKFIVAYTDMHPGGDCLAAFRDPQRLCMDVLSHPDEIKAMVGRVTQDFLLVYDLYHEKLQAAGMPSTSWLPAISSGKYHIPSNDFSCMISDEQFEDLFVPGLVEECAHMTHNIYHLDGRQALRFLDTIMDIPNMHAIQWVPGSGHDDWHQWIDVYRRIQARGKSFIASIPVSDLEEFMGCLRPEGAWLSLWGIASREEADAVLKRIAKWGTA